MGFGKQRNEDDEAEDQEERPRKKKRRKGKERMTLEVEQRSTVTKGFVPSTREELKQYSKAGKRRQEASAEAKQGRKSKKRHGTSLRGEDLRLALINEEKIPVYTSNLFDEFIDACKRKERKPPKYREYLEEKKADGEFMYEIISILSALSWTELSILIRTALTADEAPIGLNTKTWSEAFNFARHLMLQAFKVVEKKGTLRLTDRTVLDEWPVESKKRPSKEDKMSDEELRKASMKAMEAEAADDEDEDEETVEGGDESEDEDEDEKPKGKKGKKAKGGKKAKDDESDDEDDESDDEDEDSEDEDSEDEDSEDEDDEEPKKGKKKPKAKGFAKGKKAKGKKAKDADDEDDDSEDGEDDEDDEDDEEKEVRAKKGKKAKAEKPAKKAKAEKAEKPAKFKLEDSTKLKRGKKRPGGGPKSKLANELIPKSGITFKKLLAAAKEEGIAPAKVKTWVPRFIKKGFIVAE